MSTTPDMNKEREAFEAWYCDQMRAAGYNADEGIAQLREGNNYGKERVMLNGKWEGWQARASLAASAGSEPVAWPKDAADVREFVGSHFRSLFYANPTGMDPHENDVYELTAHDLLSAFRWWAELYPSPPEGAGWTKAKDQLPPCIDGQLYIGINSARFACMFNAITSDIGGDVHCLYETGEESIDMMGCLDIWQPFNPPAPPASEAKGA